MALTNLTGTDQFDVVETKLDAAIDAVNQIQGGSTDQIFKKTDGTDFNFEATNSILPASGTNNLKIKKLNIGDWNMDTTSSVSVAHGLASNVFKNVVALSAMIRSDLDNFYYSFVNSELLGSGTSSTNTNIAITNTNVVLNRAEGGIYDDTGFNSTSYNRGYIIIIYEG